MAARVRGESEGGGFAGGVVLALVDEGFKRNWLVFDFEVPAERKPMWLNVLDPEENYGVLAARPGENRWRVTIDGRMDDWNGVPSLLTRREGGPEHPFKDGYDRARTLRGLAVGPPQAPPYLRLRVGPPGAGGGGAPPPGEGGGGGG